MTLIERELAEFRGLAWIGDDEEFATSANGARVRRDFWEVMHLRAARGNVHAKQALASRNGWIKSNIVRRRYYLRLAARALLSDGDSGEGRA